MILNGAHVYHERHCRVALNGESSNAIHIDAESFDRADPVDDYLPHHNLFCQKQPHKASNYRLADLLHTEVTQKYSSSAQLLVLWSLEKERGTMSSEFSVGSQGRQPLV